MTNQTKTIARLLLNARALVRSAPTSKDRDVKNARQTADVVVFTLLQTLRGKVEGSTNFKAASVAVNDYRQELEMVGKSSAAMTVALDLVNLAGEMHDADAIAAAPTLAEKAPALAALNDDLAAARAVIEAKLAEPAPTSDEYQLAFAIHCDFAMFDGEGGGRENFDEVTALFDGDKARGRRALANLANAGIICDDTNENGHLWQVNEMNTDEASPEEYTAWFMANHEAKFAAS